MSHTRLSLALGSAFLLTGQSHAAVLAYEGFNTGSGGYNTFSAYANPNTTSNTNALVWSSGTATDSPTSGQGPTVSGFASSQWKKDGSVTLSSNVYAKVQATQSMSYTTASSQKLDTSGGDVSVFRGTGVASGTKAFGRDLNIGTSDTYGSTLYISGMFTFTTSVVSSSISSASLNLTNSSTQDFKMAIGSAGNISLTGNNATGGTAANGTVLAGTTYFFVWKLEDSTVTGAGDRLTLFLNPTDLSSEGANTLTAATSGASGDFFAYNDADFTLENIAFGSAIDGGNAFLVDEFRIGETWADVTPFTIVPEPASALLLSLGALLAFRRKR